MTHPVVWCTVTHVPAVVPPTHETMYGAVRLMALSYEAVPHKVPLMSPAEVPM